MRARPHPLSDALVARAVREASMSKTPNPLAFRCFKRCLTCQNQAFRRCKRRFRHRSIVSNAVQHRAQSSSTRRCEREPQPVPLAGGLRLQDAFGPQPRGPDHHGHARRPAGHACGAAVPIFPEAWLRVHPVLLVFCPCCRADWTASLVKECGPRVSVCV